MKIIQPRFLSLDSSTLAKLAKDYWSGDESNRTKVIAFRDSLIDNNWFLTLSSEHLFELAQHANDEIVVSRFRFLRTFDNLAWSKNFEGNGIGSVADIDCYEIQAFVQNKIQNKTAILNEVRKQLFVVGLGSELFREVDYPLWIEIAREIRPSLSRAQATASIVRTEPVLGIRQKKLRDFEDIKLENVDAIPNKTRRLAEIMAKQIEELGDKRVKNADELAIEFYKQTLCELDGVDVSKTNVFERVAAIFEIPAKLINLEMTVDQIGEWAHFSMVLVSYSRKLKFPVTLEDVKPDELPSWSFRSKLREFQNQALRVSGSDFGDSSLACLIPYLDSCEVDKRTWDYLRRINCKTNPQFDFLKKKNWFRCSNYDQILATIQL